MRIGASGVPGVRWKPERGKYQARVVVGRREVHLGYFATIGEAAAARERAVAGRSGGPGEGERTAAPRTRPRATSPPGRGG